MKGTLDSISNLIQQIFKELFFPTFYHERIEAQKVNDLSKVTYKLNVMVLIVYIFREIYINKYII